jgi:hypothetical protein
MNVNKIEHVLNKCNARAAASPLRDGRRTEMCEDAHRAPPAARRPINLPGLPPP